MRVRVVVVVVVGERETPLEFYNITICLQTGGWRRRPSASIFFVFFVFFCVLCWRERAAGGSARKDLAENQNMSSLFRCFFTSLNLFPLGANERTKGMRSHTIFQVILLCLLVRVPQTNTPKEAAAAFFNLEQKRRKKKAAEFLVGFFFSRRKKSRGESKSDRGSLVFGKSISARSVFITLDVISIRQRTSPSRAILPGAASEINQTSTDGHSLKTAFYFLTLPQVASSQRRNLHRGGSLQTPPHLPASVLSWC